VNNKIIVGKTVHNILCALENEMRPIHYIEAFDRFAVFERKIEYSEKTKRREKLRQMFSETNREIFVHDGYLFRHDWLNMDVACDSLFRPDVFAEPLNEIQIGECLYECGRRHDYMIGKFRNKNSKTTVEKRKVAALIERSVSEYFLKRWPHLYIEPSNKHDYTRYAPDDFSLFINGKKLIFDVKTFTREFSTVLTKSKNNEHIVYLFAEWNHPKAKLVGYFHSKDVFILNVLPRFSSTAYQLGYDQLLPINRLIVAINAMSSGVDFGGAERSFNNKLAVA
jgi:hypothetical protein